MIYSVFNYDTRKYTYYKAPGAPPATGSFRQPGAEMLPEALLARLPPDAVRVPVEPGDMPKGIIATTDHSVAGLSGMDVTAPPWVSWGSLAAVVGGFFLGRLWSRR